MLTVRTMALAIGVAAFSHTGQEDLQAKWADFLRPKSEECTFEAVRWRGTFWSAVLEAQKSKKPILLWAMNGHPMACT